MKIEVKYQTKKYVPRTIWTLANRPRYAETIGGFIEVNES
jgi:hypothetical protein